ncbi:MAG: ABC transporter substrate-binding protein, partial [Candidatus Limnocylindrales bacterium]
MKSSLRRPTIAARVLALGAAGALLFAACSGTASPAPASTAPSSAASSTTPSSSVASTAPSASAAASFGPAEQTSLTVGIRLPNGGSVAPFYIATDKGYFSDLGLNVKLLVVEDTRAATVGGSLDVGVIEIGPLAQAATQGLGLQIFSGYRCHRQYTMAVRPEIKTVQDLSGKDALIAGVAGDPDAGARKLIMKQAGWDLDSVNPPPTYVVVPGGSNAWTNLFVAGKLYLTPVFDQTKASVLAAGGTIITNKLTGWPNDVLFAKASWLQQNPNTAARLTAGLMRAVDYLMDPANQSAVIAELTADGVKIPNETKSAQADPTVQVFDQFQYCDNLFIDQQSTEDLLQAQGVTQIPAWSTLADLTPLETAQQVLGKPSTAPPVPT